MTRVRWAVAVVACAAMLAGCGPSEKEVSKVSQTHESQVKATADLIVATVIAQNPDVKTRVDHFPGLQDGWSDCSDGLRPTDEVPKKIQWSSDRVVYLENPRETASLIDPVIKVFLDEGWAAGLESNDPDGNRLVTAAKDGGHITLSGNKAAVPGRVSSFGISVSSACSSPPASILDWKPDTATPTPGS